MSIAVFKSVTYIPFSKEFIFDGPPPVACWPTWADRESTPMWRFNDEVWYVPAMHAMFGLTGPSQAMDLSMWTEEELAEWTGEMREDEIELFPLPGWFKNFVFRVLRGRPDKEEWEDEDEG